jgi:hypothetical protein
MNKRTKNILAAFILLVLCLPMLQELIHLFPEKPLTGRNSASSVKPVFKMKNWLNGKWQDSTVIYDNQHFGLRTWCMRMNNQFYFSLFDRARANGLIVGKNDYLFDINYINACLGKDSKGYAVQQKYLEKFRFVQNALQKRNITLLLVMMPGKATFYSEFLPDKYAAEPRGVTNNMLLHRISDSLGVNCVDLSPYLLDVKKQSPYPLYPPYGIHWSEYGMLLGMDSVGRFIEKKRGIDLPDVKLAKMVWTDSARGDDYDIGNGANLLFDLPPVRYAYPDYQMLTENKTQLDALCVGDSYYWQFFATSKMEREWFRNSKYWFYFRELHTRDVGEVSEAESHKKLREEVFSKQVILILNCDANLENPGNGFVEEVYDMLRYTGKYAGTETQRLKDIERDIRADKNWMELIRQKAEKSNIPIDTMVKKDSKYVLDHEWD